MLVIIEIAKVVVLAEMMKISHVMHILRFTEIP
jgi:hypothetical protein